jgi:peptide/nickel transport system substrate-binding protein
LEHVIYSNVPEFNTRLLRLQAGDADISYLSTRAQTQQLKDAKPAGVRLIEYLPGFVTETFHLNKAIQGVEAGNEYTGSGKCDGNGIPSDFFADIHVRKAFAHSFNQPQFIQDFLLGAGVVAATPIPPAVEFFDPSVQAIPFDLEEAEREFKLARCTGSDKSVWETGFKFIATYNAGNARRKAALEQLEFYIESLNAKRPGLPPFDITIRDVPGAIFFNPNQQRITPMFVGGWSPDFIDIDNWIRQWMDAQAGTFSAVTGLSALGAKADEWIALLNEGIRTIDKARRQAIYSQLQREYVEYVVAITMPTRTLDNVERSWVNGNYYNPGEGDPQNPPDVYVLSKKAGGKANETELAPYAPTITEF